MASPRAAYILDDYVRRNNFSPPPSFKNGQVFLDADGVLLRTRTSNRELSVPHFSSPEGMEEIRPFLEYDLHPKVPGQPRGPERIVISRVPLLPPRREEMPETAARPWLEITATPPTRRDAAVSGATEPSTWGAVIDARYCRDDQGFFEVMQAKLGLPHYFGFNWDAFNECFQDLLDISEGGMGSAFGGERGQASHPARPGDHSYRTSPRSLRGQ
jgi:Barstar (barnase inhibitor)